MSPTINREKSIGSKNIRFIDMGTLFKECGKKEVNHQILNDSVRINGDKLPMNNIE